MTRPTRDPDWLDALRAWLRAGTERGRVFAVAARARAAAWLAEAIAAQRLLAARGRAWLADAGAAHRELAARVADSIRAAHARALPRLEHWLGRVQAMLERRVVQPIRAADIWLRPRLEPRLRAAAGRTRLISARSAAGLGALAVRRRAAATRVAAVLAARAPHWLRWPRWLRPRHALVVIAPLVILLGVLYTNCGVGGCPDVRQLAAYQPGGASVLLDRHGERFADLAPYERVVVSLDSLPDHVPAAFIAIEDRRFWRHQGVDWPRVVGAALANLRSRSVEQGSSTIPMQLARNVFPRELPGTERTVKRKLQEVRVAGRIESHFTKHEILELYLNHIYFGGGAYGVEAAARLYFGKAAAELTLAEAATLAALPKAPSHYDPRRHAERSQQRRDLVLALMERQALVDSAAVAAARATALDVRMHNGRDRSGVPLGAYYIDIVRDLVEARLGDAPYRSRLRIHTALDSTAQRSAERELAAQLATLDGRVRAGEGELQGAFVIMEAQTGDVLALVGGRDPLTSRYNRALLGRRQVGSAFKPFVFAAALQFGIPTSQLVLDAPLRMQLSRNAVWEPSNFDGRYEGTVSLRRALVLSRNVPTVRLASAVGIADIARTARTAGVREHMDETPALALGTVATSPLRLAAAYTTFATLGYTAEPRFVLRVEDEAGNILWEPPHPAPANGMDPAVAYIVTDMLRDAVDYGTGTGVRRAGYRGVAAGKTGTTNRAVDAWFVGYTPDLVGAVWIGYDRPSPLGGGATGGGFAAPVWGRVMSTVYAARPQPAEWRAPPGVQRHRIDPASGLVLQEGCHPRYGGASSEVFLARAVPGVVCPYRDYWADFWQRMRGPRDRRW